MTSPPLSQQARALLLEALSVSRLKPAPSDRGWVQVGDGGELYRRPRADELVAAGLLTYRPASPGRGPEGRGRQPESWTVTPAGQTLAAEMQAGRRRE